MENKKRMPATVLAQMEVFDYLKEKVGERKTRTEAYCDLLDKAMAGFVSSYLRRQDYELRPCQCHVTVSDLAVEWRWHRATVRSFLDTLVYRLEKIKKLTGLDLREFDDAIIFKVALMVKKYLVSRENRLI